MTFEPAAGERWIKKQEVVKVSPVTSSLQARDESGGMIVSTRVIKRTHTHIVQEVEAQMWCTCVCVPTCVRVCVCVCAVEEARRVSLQM